MRRRHMIVNALLSMWATLLAVSPLMTAYGSAAWAAATLPAAALGAGAALMGAEAAPRWLRLGGSPLLLTACVCVVGPLLAFAGAAPRGGVPLMDALGAFKTFVAMTPPVGGNAGAPMVAWTVALLTAYMSCAAALAEAPWARACVPVPLAAGFAASAALGTASGSLPAQTGIALTLTVVCWLA